MNSEYIVQLWFVTIQSEGEDSTTQAQIMNTINTVLQQATFPGMSSYF